MKNSIGLTPEAVEATLRLCSKPLKRVKVKRSRTIYLTPMPSDSVSAFIHIAVGRVVIETLAAYPDLTRGEIYEEIAKDLEMRRRPEER